MHKFYICAMWIAETSDGSTVRVPSVSRDNSENILRYGQKALLRRLLRSDDYLSIVGNGHRVVKFKNLKTGEEHLFVGKHAGFTDLFAVKMEAQKCNHVTYTERKIFSGNRIVTTTENLEFEGSPLKSVRKKMAEIGKVDQFIQIGRRAFIGVATNENAQVNTPLIVEHEFVFKKGTI